MRTLQYLILLLPFLSIAQVGVNTTTPNAALDIQSTNNGFLIPRVQLTDALDIVTVVNPSGGILAKSTLVYNIGLSGIAPDNVIDGFYYWNGVRWIPLAGNAASDHDWYEEGTTNSPNAITDDMFHTGNVAIGKNIANYPLDIESSTNSVGINTSISGDFQKKGISSNLVYGSGIQDQTGIESVINSTISSSSNPYIYSFKSSLTNTGQGENYGFHNTVTNTNVNATTFGIKNILNTRNNATGTENTINSTGNPLEISGTKNTIFGTNDTATFGTKNEITQTGPFGDRFGTYNNLNNSIGTNLYGICNTLSSGNTNRYGSFNVINNNGGFGSNYGVYSNVLTSGSENYAGYFLGNVAIGRTNLNKYILPQTRGTNGQIMQTDGAGNVTWQNPTSFGWELDGNTAITTPVSPGTYGTSTIAATENFIGTTDANDFTIGTNNIERMRVKSTTGNVGIGTANPLQPLHVFKNSNITKSAILGEAIQSSTTLDYQNKGVEGYGSGTAAGGGYGYGIGVLGIGDRVNSYFATGVFGYLGTTSPNAPATNQALLANGNNLGNAAILTNGNVGIGIPLGTNPTNQLHVNSATAGAVRIVDGTQAAGRVLTSTATGVGTWQPPIPSGFTHYLGELYLGGIIFELYKGSDGLEHGLIVSLTESGMLAWQTTNVLVGANRSEDGAFNTALMTSSPAATYIATLGAGWYLPSIDELYLLNNHRYYANKGLRLGGYTLISSTRVYWSSTENDVASARALNINLGTTLLDSKPEPNYVRGIRAF